MEEFANWDDPTTVDWGAEDASKETTQQIQNTTTTTTTTAAAPISNEQIFKCTACNMSIQYISFKSLLFVKEMKS